MKYIKIVLTAFILVISSCEASEDKINEDIDDIVEAVKEQDKLVFSSFFEDKSLIPNEKEYEYYFGKTKEFFDKTSIEYTIFSADEVSPYSNGGIALVVFYDSTKVKDIKFVDWTWIGEHWLKDVLVLELKRDDHGWKFIETPFFFFRHAPWADDYG